MTVPARDSRPTFSPTGAPTAAEGAEPRHPSSATSRVRVDACPVCGGTTHDAATWRGREGVQWPAIACVTCGAVTKRMNVEPVRAEATARRSFGLRFS